MGIGNTPPKTWTKIIQTMVFTKYPREGNVFLLGFVKAMQYLSMTFEICHGAQRISNILLKGVLHEHSVIMGTSNTPPITWTKIIQSMVFIKYPHEGITFYFRFELLIFEGKKRIFV
jgi:hypothetical protein